MFGSKKVLRIHLKLFQGKWGNWKGATVEIELIPGATPCTAGPFPVPQAYRQLVKDEVYRLVEIGLLSPMKESEWSSPLFTIPKKGQYN